jgi:hypothetical protein
MTDKMNRERRAPRVAPADMYLELLLALAEDNKPMPMTINVGGKSQPARS